MACTRRAIWIESGLHCVVVGASLSRKLVCDVHFTTTTTTTGFLLLTWEFASLDGYTACGEVRCEELRLCGLA